MSARTVTLGSIAKITSGGTPERTKSAYWNGTIPWVKTAQIQNCTITAECIDEWITQEGLEHSSARLIPKGTILMAMYGQGKTRGQVAILGIDATINQACAAILLKPEVNRDYVYQQLLYRYKSIRALSNTGSQENLNSELIREITFPLLALEEQREIAQALFVWDIAIQKTEQLIAAKEQRLAAIRQNLFVRSTRKGYVRVRLDSVLKETGELSDGNLPVYSVSVHKGLINQIEHLGRSFSAATTAHYNLVRPGDIVYTKSPTGDFPYGIVKQSSAIEIAAVSPLYGVYRPSHADIGTLVDFFFESPVNAKNYLHPLVQKGAKNTISIGNDQFLKGDITLPEGLDQIARLSSFIREARAETTLLKKSVAALKTQKRGLMQKLLTGRWRLPDKEEAN